MKKIERTYKIQREKSKENKKSLSSFRKVLTIGYKDCTFSCRKIIKLDALNIYKQKVVFIVLKVDVVSANVHKIGRCRTLRDAWV